MKTDRNKQLLGLLAKNVRSLRKNIGLSQEDLAFQCDIDRTYISKVERGIANPSLLVLSRIAEILQVEIKDLIKKK
ncbi:helix-turn-helix domain-containing protein [Polynucleobacter sinensis]|uniref:helix-turn-helix domain-containing protein n=1 Tax=Polynucleobacter sinensis TaxID=1743157 RepID=UPI000781D44F|nr:helix-turn-helix transcriptional regulator [Polynucleobacter sinensis]